MYQRIRITYQYYWYSKPYDPTPTNRRRNRKHLRNTIRKRRNQQQYTSLPRLPKPSKHKQELVIKP